MRKRKPVTYRYEMPIVGEIRDVFDVAAHMAGFLMKNTGTVLGRFCGYMRAEDQRQIFGRVLGRGKVLIDGEREEYGHAVKVCFGTDSSYTEFGRWIEFMEKGKK